MSESYYNREEAARVLGVGVSTVDRYRREGRLAAANGDGPARYLRRHVETLYEQLANPETEAQRIQKLEDLTRFLSHEIEQLRAYTTFRHGRTSHPKAHLLARRAAAVALLARPTWTLTEVRDLMSWCRGLTLAETEVLFEEAGPQGLLPFAELLRKMRDHLRQQYASPETGQSVLDDQLEETLDTLASRFHFRYRLRQADTSPTTALVGRMMDASEGLDGLLLAAIRQVAA